MNVYFNDKNMFNKSKGTTLHVGGKYHWVLVGLASEKRSGTTLCQT